MKILWLTNVPSPYRVDFFNQLGELCKLTVLFERENSSERDGSWATRNFINFTGIVLNGIKMDVDKAMCINVIKYLDKGKYDFIIVSNIATPTGIIAVEYMKLFKVPYIIEGDGGFAKNGKGFKEIIKKHLVKGANAYFSTADSYDNYLVTYGAKKESIYRYPFTSIKNEDIVSNPIDAKEKKLIKEKLGIKEKKILVSVGQFIFRKGYDLLINACKDIDKDIGVYIIGGQPTVEYIRLKQDLKLDNINFVGFKKKEELIDYYKAADLFVLPTREDIWGLVINEAMACGLPIITTDRCVAGLELVNDGINGYIVSVGDNRTLLKRINNIMNDDQLRSKMAKKSLEKIKSYTIENMVKRHIEVLEELGN